MSDRPFMGRRITIAAGAYILFLMSALSLFNPILGFFPDYYGADLLAFAFAVNFCSIIGAVSGLVAANFLRRVPPRSSMVIGGLLLVAYGLVMCFVRSFVGMCVGFSILGLHCGIFAHPTVTELVMRWYEEKRSQMVGLVMGVAMFGTALGMTISTFVFNLTQNVGLTFLYSAGGLGCVCILIALLLVKNDPKDVGQLPYGVTEGATVMQQDAADMTADEKPKLDLKHIYANPVFWMLVVATIFVNCGIAPVCSYMNTYVTSLGADFNLGALFMSVMGYTAAIAMLLSPKIIDHIGVRAFVLVCAAGCILANGSMLFVAGAIGNGAVLIGVLCLVAIGYTFGFCLTVMHPVLTSKLFKDKDLATEANTKLGAVLYGASIILMPTLTSVATNVGFPAFFTACLGLDVLILIAFVAAFAFAKRQGVEV